MCINVGCITVIGAATQLRNSNWTNPRRKSNMAKRLQPSELNRHASIFYGLASVLLVFAVLYWAKPVLVPLALGVLLTFVLTPAVIKLEKWHVRRHPAVLGVTFAAFTILFLIIWVTGSQIQLLAHDLPNHQSEIQRKVAGFKSGKYSTLNRLTRMFDEVTGDLVEKPSSESDSKTNPSEGHSVDEKTPADEVVVEPATIVVSPDQSAMETLFNRLTVCMVVLGQHISSLSWLEIPLAEQSEMEPWLQYYQRLLSNDAFEVDLLLKKSSNELEAMKSFDDIIVGSGQ